MTRFVGILSGKGGVAKTTTTVNLGAALNYFKRDVIIVDGNLSTPNLGLHLGIPIVPISLHDVLKNKNNIVESIYQHESGLKIIPSSLSLSDLKGVDPIKIQKVMPSLEGLTDIVLVDSSAGIGSEALAVINSVDDVIVVTNPELPAVTDALKIVKISQQMGKNVKGVILTKTGQKDDISPESISNLLEVPILATIPFDKFIRKSLIEKKPVIYSKPNSKSSKSYKKLAADLIGVDYTESENLFSKILNKIGFNN